MLVTCYFSSDVTFYTDTDLNWIWICKSKLVHELYFRFHPCADPAWDADVQPRELHRAAGAPRAVARGAGRGRRRRDLPGVRRLRGPISRGRER